MKSAWKGCIPEVYVVRDRDFTVAFGIFESQAEGWIPFAGATKRNPKDKDNHVRGENLALGNAFRNLGRQILKEEYNRIHSQYHTKDKKKEVEVVEEEPMQDVEESVYAKGWHDGYEAAAKLD